jgi:hypothetical protein
MLESPVVTIDVKRQRLAPLIEQFLAQACESRQIADNTRLPRPLRVRSLGYAEGLETAARKLQLALEDLENRVDV